MGEEPPQLDNSNLLVAGSQALTVYTSILLGLWIDTGMETAELQDASEKRKDRPSRSARDRMGGREDNTCLNGSRDFLQNLGPINTQPPGKRVMVTADNEEIEEWSQLLY